MTKPKREHQRIRLAAATFLERTKRLLQNAAIDLYPAVAEEHQRRTLVEEKPQFLGGDRLASDADDQSYGMCRLLLTLVVMLIAAAYMAVLLLLLHKVSFPKKKK